MSIQGSFARALKLRLSVTDAKLMDEAAKPARRHLLTDPLRVERVPSPNSSSHLMGYASDVSETGMFVQCALPPPAGTTMTLQVRMESDDELVVRRARVVWVRDRSTAPYEPTGVGVALSTMEDGSRERWVEFCRRQNQNFN